MGFVCPRPISFLWTLFLSVYNELNYYVIIIHACVGVCVREFFLSQNFMEHIIDIRIKMICIGSQ